MIFAQKIDVVFQALIQASGDSTPDLAFSPPGLLWLGGTLFLLGTAGLLATTRIALAVLLAIGPVFVVLRTVPRHARAVRRLAQGRGHAGALRRCSPSSAASLMLELSVPVLSALVAVPGQIDPQAAMAFFMIAAVHTRTDGHDAQDCRNDGQLAGRFSAWQAGPGPTGRSPPQPQCVPSPPIPRRLQVQRSTRLAAAAPRRTREIRLTAPASIAANDAGPASQRREVRAVGATGQPVTSNSISRVLGVGSRFRSPPPRMTEKVK